MKPRRLAWWIAQTIAFAAIDASCIDATTVYTVPDMPPSGDDGSSEASDDGADRDGARDGARTDGGGTSNDAGDGSPGD